MSQKVTTGSWSYDSQLLNFMLLKSEDDYIKAIDASMMDREWLMTIFVLAYFQYHSDKYGYYQEAKEKAEVYMSNKVADLNSLIGNLLQIGFK